MKARIPEEIIEALAKQYIAIEQEEEKKRETYRKEIHRLTKLLEESENRPIFHELYDKKIHYEYNNFVSRVGNKIHELTHTIHASI